MACKVFTIAAGLPFAETLARGLMAREETRDPLALSRITIFLPTRRAVRTMGEIFAKVAGGAALLPEMKPLGGVEEDELLFDPEGDIDLPPAIHPVRRRLLLAAMIRRWDAAARRGGLGFAQSTALARGLAQFLDEAQTQSADLSKLEELAPAALAEHWAQVKEFLTLLRGEWPKLLAAEGAIDPADHRNRSLKALERRLETNPPDAPVIAAGSTGSIPATAELLGIIARLPMGAVILPGLDRDLDEESWNNLDPGHPQFGMKELLRRIGVERGDVKDWTETKTAPRETLLRETLRPAPTTDAWRALAESGSAEIAAGLDGMSLIEAANPQAEAGAIAMILREVLETAARTAALVTPDRNLARRVAAEMSRWGIAIDDSAGRPLANTAPGTFLCLLAEAVDSEFAPVALLALLKHPLAAGGQALEIFRARVRELDRTALRGPRPNPGLDGIAALIADEELKKWFACVAKILRPLASAFAKSECVLTELVKRHIGVAQALAESDAERGAARLWQGDAGEAAAKLTEALFDSASGLPAIETRAYPAMFRAFAEEIPVRGRFGQHPRLAILGPLEARLQSFDTVVMGGLNEGTWPASAATDPWLSRPMRGKLGLEAPERAIGLSAHDFAALAGRGRVLLTRSVKEQGAPTVASRWVQRLIQLTKGLGLAHKLDSGGDYAGFAGRIDEAEKPAREPRPAPKPPVKARPRSLSVTEIEKWLRDPYWIYAKHVLRLKPLDPLEAEIGPLERGTAVHQALERFLRAYSDALPPDAEAKLIAIANDVFRAANVPKAVQALWGPRFLKAARWFVGVERARRRDINTSFIEIEGRREFAGGFTLRARADRIDVLAKGGAAIVDYKTGAPPNKKQVHALLAPQLPLEGAILVGGGFKEIGKLAAASLLYIQFSGGREPGKLSDVSGDDLAALVAEAEARLVQRIEDFADVATPYLPRVMPYRAEIAGDYDHLARVREWSFSGWEEDE